MTGKTLGEVPEQELRLAVVLNGGVSLAVWMGGVAHELDRLTRSAGAIDDDPAQNPYGALLWLAGARAVVDVISGTSAGGINGAALALAQVNPKADLVRLRSLWSEQGRMEELLRQPFQGNPNSLLRGDDYFLPQLNSALTGLASSFEPTQSAEPRSVDLTITTTLLTGAPLVTVDDQGQELPQRLHAAHFQFCVAEDDTKTELVDKAGAMALAARCTASFPLAFEPSYVPLLARATGDPLRPDMEPYASWAVPESRRPADYDGSRYAVDGGVLANTPTKAALDAISKRRADGPVRRTMLLVFPHAPGAGEVGHDAQDQPFTAAGALTGVLGALQSQGSRTYVERLEEHNRRAADWRGGRRDVLETLGQDDDMAGLYGLVEAAWPYYRCLRRRRAAADLAERVAPRLRRKDWPYERVRRAAETAQGAHPPYVPSQPPHLTPTPSGDPDDLGWNWGFSVALGVVDAVREIFRGALEVGRADEVTTLRRVLPRIYEAIAGIEEARRAVDDDWVTDAYLTSLEPDEHYWAARLLAYRWGLDPREAAARDRTQLDQLLPPLEGLDTVREHALDRLAARDGEAGRRARAAVTSAVEALVEVRGTVLAVARTTRSDVLEAWLPLLTTQRTPPPVPGEGRGDEAQASYGGEPAGGVERLLQRLLSLDVATWLVADGPATGTSLPISLLQLSLRTEHPWARHSITPDDKAAGMELARFGGFLKRSWRMNDWAWGRLDAVTMLCRAALDPRRLRSIAQLSECAADDVFGTLRKHLYGSGALPELVSSVEEKAKTELRTVFDTAEPLPPALPHLAAFLAFPIQAAAMLEELPVVVAAIELDRVEGASRRSRGERFLVDQRRLIERVHEHQGSAPSSAPDRDRATSLQLGSDALAAFDAAGIGREPFVDELGSDSLIRTVTKAAGAVATVLDSSESGLKAIKQITGTVRGAMLLPYWVIVGLTSASALAQFVATLGLVAGGTLLILALFGVLGGFAALGATIGAGAVLAAFSYSAFRTGSLLHASALLAPIGPLVAFALHTSESGAGEQATSAGESASRVLVLAVVVACLYGLGRLPWPVASPIVTTQSTLARSWRRHPIRTIATPVVVLLLIAAAVLWWSPSWLPAWAERLRGRLAEWLEPASDWFQSLAEEWPFEVATYALWSVVLVLAGSFWSYYSGTQLRIWRPTATIGFGGQKSLRGTFRLDRVISAAGVAATWAVFYGAAYLAAAWIVWALALRGDPDDPAGWLVFTVWWCASVALVLIMLAPLVLGRRARLQARHALVASGIDLEEGDRAVPGTSKTSDVEQRTLDALMKSDMAFQAVCRSKDARRFVPLVGRQASEVALHWRGRRMLRAARKRASLTRSRPSG